MPWKTRTTTNTAAATNKEKEEEKEQEETTTNHTTAHIEVTDAIREWDYGEYEGLTSAQIQARRQAAGEPEWDIWRDGCPGGECVVFFSLFIYSYLSPFIPIHPHPFPALSFHTIPYHTIPSPPPSPIPSNNPTI